MCLKGSIFYSVGKTSAEKMNCSHLYMTDTLYTLSHLTCIPLQLKGFYYSNIKDEKWAFRIAK